MVQQILITLGAGLASGILFVLPAKGMLLGIWLSVLAPMPLMIATLGYGLMYGLAAVVIGAALAALFQPALGLVFLVSSGAPSLILGWLARHTFSGERRLGPGILLAVTATLSILAAWGMVATASLSYGGLEAATTEIASGIEEALKQMKGVEEASGGIPPADFARLLVVSAPAIMAFWSVVALALNLWLAGRVVLISGALNRPWPDLPSSLDLPRVALGAFALFTLASAIPGVIRVLASSAAVALGVAFALQGLAAVHRITRGRLSRAGLLSALYALILILFPLPLFVVAGVGIADNVRPLRRSNPSPKSNDH